MDTSLEIDSFVVGALYVTNTALYVGTGSLGSALQTDCIPPFSLLFLVSKEQSPMSELLLLFLWKEKLWWIFLQEPDQIKWFDRAEESKSQDG